MRALSIALILLATQVVCSGQEIIHNDRPSSPKMSFNEHFNVTGPMFTKEIMDAATKHKAAVKAEWGVGFKVDKAIISWKPDPKDEAFTWQRAGNRKYHAVYMFTSIEKALTSTLKHEVAHVVLGEAIPLWAHEGIASSYDDARRKTMRRILMEDGPTMRPLKIIMLKEVRSLDEYANCATLVSVMAGLRGKKAFLKFAEDCHQPEIGFETALETHYNMSFENLCDLYLGEER